MRWRCWSVTRFVLLAVVLAGCGSSSTTKGGVSQIRTRTVTSTVPVPRPTTRAAGAAQFALDPLSGGTECVVSYRGAFVIFKSSGYDVTPACSAQISAGAAIGQQWTYPTGGQVAGNSPVCTLTTAMAMATIYDAADDIGQLVCRSLVRAGWARA